MHPRFVKAEVTTLTISRDETLTIKRRLNAGEQRKAYQRMFRAGENAEARGVPLEVGLQTILAYLVEWTVKDDDGRPVPYGDLDTLADKTDTLNALDPEDFGEILAAINAHEERMATERAEEKKTIPTGETRSPQTSISPGAAGGASSGFVN